MRHFLLALALTALITRGLYVPSGAAAQAAGVDFWVPAGTIIDAADEEIVFLQGSVATAWLEPSCGVPAPGDYPMQPVAAASRLFGVIVLTELPPQARLGNLTYVGSCFVGGIRYQRLMGAVQ